MVISKMARLLMKGSNYKIPMKNEFQSLKYEALYRIKLINKLMLILNLTLFLVQGKQINFNKINNYCLLHYTPYTERDFKRSSSVWILLSWFEIWAKNLKLTFDENKVRFRASIQSVEISTHRDCASIAKTVLFEIRIVWIPITILLYRVFPLQRDQWTRYSSSSVRLGDLVVPLIELMMKQLH